MVRYSRIGRLETPWGELTLFWTEGYGGNLFLPFRDATAPEETYGAGRYLTDAIKGTFGGGLEAPPPGSETRHGHARLQLRLQPLLRL